MAITLKQAFALNGTPDLDSFNDLQEQCKNTDYFSDSKPINHLSSWEGYWYGAGYDLSISLSSTSVAATGGAITVTYTIKEHRSTGDVLVSGVKPTVTSTLGTVSNITTTNTSGVGTATITIDNNKSLSSKSIKVTVSSTLGGSVISKESTATQSAGYYTYGAITINTFSYGAVGAAGGTSSPSITYSQPYGWNGATSGAGTINGNGDDEYTTYSETGTHSALTVDESSGVVTWTKNNATSGTVDAARSGKITATVERNGKKVTKKATTTQNAEKISSYGAWSFTVKANTSSIAATGGSVTFTISRPTRTVTYDSGDTQTETASTGTFALTRSNSNFTLSTSSISMTASSLPTFTLSIGATGASAVSAISSTVTAAFTATSPNTGTTTKSVTSSSVTRAASSLVKDHYRFNTFSVAKSSFTAATGTTTLSMVVQKRSEYTGSQYSSWATITPASGTLSVTAGTGGSVGTITYGTTSTCTITVAANTNASSGRSISISGKYNTDKATSSLTISQDADSIKTYGDVTISSFSYSNVGPSTSSKTVSPSISASQTITYVSGHTRAGSISCSYKESTTSSYAEVNSSTGVVTWNANPQVTSDRTVGITVTATGEGSKSATKTATSKCVKDSIKTYGDVTASIGSGITAANGSATVTGSQTLTWTSGSTSSGTISYAINKQYIGTRSTATTGTTITRYSLSGTKLSHTTMGTNTGYDIVVVTATGQGSKTATAQTSVYNGVTSTEYGNYKTTISLANTAPTCSSGTTTATIKTYRQARSKYTSGSYGSYGSDTLATVGTPTVSESVNWLSVGTVSNSSTGTYTATVTYNANSKNTSTRSATLTATANSVSGTVTLTQGKDSYTDSGGVTSTTYGNWGGGAISFSSTTALSAAADSRTVTIQPWSRTKTVSTTAKIRTWTCGGTETLVAASSNTSTEYYTGTVAVSENGSYTSLSATSYTASSSAKTLTLTKTTCGANITSAATVTVTANPSTDGPATTTKSISQTANALTKVAISVKSGTTPIPYGGGTVTLQCKGTFTSGTHEVTPSWTGATNGTLSSTTAKNPTLTVGANSGAERDVTVSAKYPNDSTGKIASLTIKQAGVPVNFTLPIDFYVQSTRGVSGAADCSFKCSGNAVLDAQSLQSFSFNSGLIRDYYYTSGSFKESKVLNLASLNVTTNTTNFSDYHLDWGFALHASGGYGSSTSSTIQYKLYWQVEKYDGTIYDLMSTSYPKTSTNYVSVDYLTTNESQTQSSSPISITNGDRIRITIVI